MVLDMSVISNFNIRLHGRYAGGTQVDQEIACKVLWPG